MQAASRSAPSAVFRLGFSWPLLVAAVAFPLLLQSRLLTTLLAGWRPRPGIGDRRSCSGAEWPGRS